MDSFLKRINIKHYVEDVYKRQIVFPMAQGGLVTVTIFNFINIWNEYFLSLMFVNSDKLRPVALGLFSMINGMQYSGYWSGLFASVIKMCIRDRAETANSRELNDSTARRAICLWRVSCI